MTLQLLVVRASAATLEINDPRPVAKAVQTLVETYGYVITYEDPRYAYEGDLEDVTAQVRKDLDRYPIGKAPKVIVPRGGKLTLDVPPITGPEDIAVVLSALSRSNRDQGGRFRVERTPDAFHVVPMEVRDTAGNWVASPSILDARISLSAQDYSDEHLIRAICDAVSRENDYVAVNLATCLGCGIRSTRGPTLYHFEARDESARSVLLRALAAIRNRRLSWSLLYGPSEKAYFLNISDVPDLTAAQQHPQVSKETSKQGVQQPRPLSGVDNVTPTAPQQPR